MRDQEELSVLSVRQARFTVCITAHYSSDRLQYLFTVLQAILAWEVASVSVTILTNNERLQHAALPFDTFRQRGWTLKVYVEDALEHPFFLTWSHKRLLAQWLHQAEENNDFFIYIEDDIVVKDANIKYLVESLATLKPYDLVPGLLRYEEDADVRYSVDAPRSTPINLLRVDNRTYAKPAFPYWAGFILDKWWGKEHITDVAFDREKSRTIDWEVRERAAAGVTWKHSAFGPISRVVLPVNENRPSPECQVWHCAQRYSGAGTAWAN